MMYRTYLQASTPVGRRPSQTARLSMETPCPTRLAGQSHMPTQAACSAARCEPGNSTFKQEALFLTPQSQLVPRERRAEDCPGTVDMSARKPTLNELEKKVTNLEQENFDLKMRMFYMRDARPSKNKGNAGSQSALDREQEEDEEALGEKVYHLSCVLQEKEAEVEAAHERLETLNTQLMEAESKYRREAALLQEQNTLLTLEASELEDKCRVLAAEQARSREREGQRLLELEEQLSKAKDQGEERAQAMLACGQRLGAYMGSMRQLQESMADKDRQIESQRESIKYLELALKDIERQYSKAVQEIRTKSEMCEQLSAAEREKETLALEVRRLEQEAQEKDEKLHRAAAGQRALQEELSSFKSEAQNVAQLEAFEIVRLQDELKHVRGVLGKSQDEATLLEDALNQQVHDYKVLGRQRQEQATREEKLLKDVKKWENKARTLQGAKEVLTERVRELESKLSSLLDKHRALQDQHHHSQRELGTQQGLVSTLRASLDALNGHPLPLAPHPRSASAPRQHQRISSSTALPAPPPHASASRTPVIRAPVTPTSTATRRRRQVPPAQGHQQGQLQQQVSLYQEEEGTRGTRLRPQVKPPVPTRQRRVDESSVSRASQEEDRPFSRSGFREEGEEERGEVEARGEGYAQRTAGRVGREREMGPEEGHERARECERDMTHVRARRAASSPDLPTPETILQRLRELRATASQRGVEGASATADEFVKECLRMLGKGERPPSTPEVPACPVNHSSSNMAPDQYFESARPQGHSGAFVKPTMLRDVDSRNLEACVPLLEHMAKLQVPIDRVMNKLDHLSIRNGPRTPESSSRSERAQNAFQAAFETVHPDIRSQLETILGPF